MYGPPGNHVSPSPYPPSLDAMKGPDAIIAAALQAAAATNAAAERAQQSAAVAVAAAGGNQGQMSPWPTQSASAVSGYPEAPKFMPPSSDRPPGFLQSADGERIEIADEENDDDAPAKSLSLPNMRPAGLHLAEEGDSPSIGSTEHGGGECTPCAWFWKPDSCLNAKDCRYCHLCPDGELKKRKKQKVAKMRLGLVTPKNNAKSPVAHTLSLSSLIS